MEREATGKFNLNKLVHERARLLILTYLAGSNEKNIPFSELKEKLEFTSGNLSVQLKNLEQAGYIKIQKKFADNKPLTTISLTSAGLQELEKYLCTMEEIINTVRNN